MTEKSIDHESSQAYATIGEDIFINNIMKRTGVETNPKQATQGPSTANATEAGNSDILIMQQTLLDSLLPAIHTVRVDVANGELVESIVNNFETRDHSVQKEYLEGIRRIQTAIDKSNISVDKRIRDLQMDSERRLQFVCESLVSLAVNQQELAKALSQVNWKVHQETPLNAGGRCYSPKTDIPTIPKFDTMHGGLTNNQAENRRLSPSVPQPGGTQSAKGSRTGETQNIEDKSAKGAAPAKTGVPDIKSTAADGILRPTNVSPITQSQSSTLVPEANMPSNRTHSVQRGGEGLRMGSRTHQKNNHGGRKDQPRTASKDTRAGPGPAKRGKYPMGSDAQGTVTATTVPKGASQTFRSTGAPTRVEKRRVQGIEVTADTHQNNQLKTRAGGGGRPRDQDLLKEVDQDARGTLGGPYAHPGRFDCLEDEETHTHIQATYVTNDSANPIAYKEYKVQDDWTLMTSQKRTQQLFEGLSDTGKRRQLRLLQEEERRERKSILIYEVPHSDLGADYELTEVQRAWPVIEEISTRNMGNKGCDIKITDIKGGRRLWEWKGDERCTCKPIKLEFHTQDMADEAMMAFRNGGMFGKRTLSKYGLFKATGKVNADKKTKRRMHKTYVYPSSTKAEREAIREQNKFSKTEFVRDKRDSHQFRKDTALDFSKFRVINGKVGPKEEQKVRTPCVTINNPKYKPWFERFSSNTTPEKITIPLTESVAEENASTGVVQKGPKKQKQKRSRGKKRVNPTPTPQLANNEGMHLPHGTPFSSTKTGEPKGSRAKAQVALGTLRRSSRLGDLRTKTTDGDRLTGTTEEPTVKRARSPNEDAQSQLVPAIGGEAIAGDFLGDILKDILNEVVETVLTNCPPEGRMGLLGAQSTLLVVPTTHTPQRTQVTSTLAPAMTEGEIFELFDKEFPRDVVVMEAKKYAIWTHGDHTKKKGYTPTPPVSPKTRTAQSPTTEGSGVSGLFDDEGKSTGKVVIEAGKRNKLTEFTKASPTDCTREQVVEEAVAPPCGAAGTGVAVAILEEIMRTVIMKARVTPRHSPCHKESSGSRLLPMNDTLARRKAVATAAAAKAKAAEVAAADSFDFWTGVLRTPTAAGNNTNYRTSSNDGGKDTTNIYESDPNSTKTDGYSPLSTDYDTKTTTLEAGKGEGGPNCTNANVTNFTNDEVSEDTKARAHSVQYQGDQVRQFHQVGLDVGVQCETVDERVYDLEREQEQVLHMAETEAKEAAAGANTSISRAVAAVRAAMDHRRSDFEAKAEEAMLSTKSSVDSVAAASRAVRNAGEAMGVDLKPIKKPKNKVIEVKHWGDVTPIVDLRRNPPVSRTPRTSTGAANNADNADNAPGGAEHGASGQDATKGGGCGDAGVGKTAQRGLPSHIEPHEAIVKPEPHEAIIKLPSRLKRGKGKSAGHGRPEERRKSDKQAEYVIQKQLQQLEDDGHAEVEMEEEAPRGRQLDRFMKGSKITNDKRMGTVTISSKKRKIRKNSRKDKDTMETCYYIRRKVCPSGVECPHYHWDDDQTHDATQKPPSKPKIPVSASRGTKKTPGPLADTVSVAILPGFTTTSSDSSESSVSTRSTGSTASTTSATSPTPPPLPGLVAGASASTSAPMSTSSLLTIGAETSNKRKGTTRAAKELARSKSKCTTITISEETLEKLKDKRRQ